MYKMDDFINFSSQGNIEKVKELLSNKHDFKILLKAYKLTFIRGLKLKPNQHIRNDLIDKIENIREIRKNNITKINNYIDEPLYVLSEKLLICGELIFNELQYQLDNYKNIIMYLKLLCRSDIDEFQRNYIQYPNININKRVNGKTLFHVACKYGNIEIVKILIDKAKINKQTKYHHKYHQSSLHIAIENHHYDIIKLLLSKGVIIDTLDYYKKTPLQYVAPGKNGNIEIFELLISHGANINEKYNGVTMLYQATNDNEIEIVEYLLKLKASPFASSLLINNNNIYEYCYQTPYELAICKNNEKIIMLFKETLNYTYKYN